MTPPNFSARRPDRAAGRHPEDRARPTRPTDDARARPARRRGPAGSTGADIALTGADRRRHRRVREAVRRPAASTCCVVVGLRFVLLMLVFRSLLVPLKAALGFLLTVGATFGVDRRGVPVGPGLGLLGLDTPGPLVSFLPILLIGILFGLAMDYEVFLVSRMREDFVHGDTARAGRRRRRGPRRPGRRRRGAHHDRRSSPASSSSTTRSSSRWASPSRSASPIDAFVVRHDARAGGHVAARPTRLVAAALAGPGAAATSTSRARACRQCRSRPPDDRPGRTSLPSRAGPDLPSEWETGGPGA